VARNPNSSDIIRRSVADVSFDVLLVSEVPLIVRDLFMRDNDRYGHSGRFGSETSVSVPLLNLLPILTSRFLVYNVGEE
jgi:hypothetical protein